MDLSDNLYVMTEEGAVELTEYIESEEEEEKDELLEFSDSIIIIIRNELGDILMEIFEESGGLPLESGFNDHLRDIDDEMSGGGSGSITLQGTQNEAESAAEQGGERVTQSIENGMKSITATDVISIIGDIIVLVAGGLLALGTVTGGISAVAAAGVGMVGLFLTFSAEFLSTAAGLTQMYTIREIHENALDAIIAGEEWV